MVSAWVWAKKAGSVEVGDYPNVLPQPETISLDGANLLKAVDEQAASTTTKTAERPVERIDGVFLDAMDAPLVRSAKGGLRKNVSFSKDRWSLPVDIT